MDLSLLKINIQSGETTAVGAAILCVAVWACDIQNKAGIVTEFMTRTLHVRVYGKRYFQKLWYV